MGTKSSIFAALASLVAPSLGAADPPDHIYVYDAGPDNQGHDDAFNSGAHGWVYKEMGLLSPRGRPPSVAGNDLKQGNAVVGHVVRDGQGKMIGVTNASGSVRAYNLDTSAKFSEAWLEVAALGTLTVAKHGVEGGGGQDLDKHTMYDGVEESPPDPNGGGGGTGSGSAGGVYQLTERPGAEITVELNSCNSTLDPDGSEGPQRSVSATFQSISGVLVAPGHDGKVYKGAELVFDIGQDIDALAEANARLLAKAKAAGAVDKLGQPSISAWVSNQPFPKQYETIEQLLAGTGILFSLEYGKSVTCGPPNGAGCYYLPITSVDTDGDTLVYQVDSTFPQTTLRIPAGSLAATKSIFLHPVIPDSVALGPWLEPASSYMEVENFDADPALSFQPPAELELSFPPGSVDFAGVFKLESDGSIHAQPAVVNPISGWAVVHISGAGVYVPLKLKSLVSADPPEQNEDIALTVLSNPGQGSVAFAISGEQPISLDVFDVRGVLVRHLDAAGTATGKALLIWDRRDEVGVRRPAGSYWARAASSTGSTVRRFVLLD